MNGCYCHPMQQEPDSTNSSNLAREEQARGIDKLITFPIDGEAVGQC